MEKFCDVCQKERTPFTFGLQGHKPLTYWVYNCECQEKKQAKYDSDRKELEIASAVRSRLSISGLPKISIDQNFTIPKVSILETDPDTGEPIQRLDYEKINKYIDSIYVNIRTGQSLFMAGNCGTGKTIIMGEIGKKAISLGFDVRYFTASKIITDKPDLNKLRFVDLLMIDDLGMAAIEKRDNRLFELVNDRIDHKLATVIATNSTEDQNKEFLGEAFVDRLKLFNTCFMIGDSRRKYNTLSENLN